MESQAKAVGHAIHQQLIPFPLGLLSTAVIFDLLRLLTDDRRYATAAFFMIAAGIVGGLLAGVFGAIDYLALPGRTRANRVGGWHGAGNAVVLVVFALSWWLRRDDPARVPETAALTLSVLGGILLTVTGWLGGELVDRHRVGIDDDASLDAPASYATYVRLGKANVKPEGRP